MNPETWYRLQAEAQERKAKRNPREWFVYFLQADRLGLLKIGRSRKPGIRTGMLKTASPLNIRVLGWVKETPEINERLLHERFYESRVRREWFAMFDDVRAVLDQLGIHYQWDEETGERMVAEFHASLPRWRLEMAIVNAKAWMERLDAGEVVGNASRDS